MMTQTKIKESYLEICRCLNQGSKLIIRSPEIINASILIVILGFTLNTFHFFPNKIISSMFLFVGTLIAFGFDLALPKFIKNKNDKQELSFKKIYYETVSNARNFIWPVILFYVLFAIIFFSVLLGYIALTLENPTTETVSSSLSALQDELQRLSPTILVINLVLSVLPILWIYATIFYSLKKQGIFKAYLSSIYFAVKNWELSSVFFVYTFVLSLVGFFLKTEGLLQLGENLILAILQLFVTATVVIYFIKKEKTKVIFDRNSLRLSLFGIRK